MACILKYVPYVFFDILKALFFYKKGGEKSPVFLPGMPYSLFISITTISIMSMISLRSIPYFDKTSESA